MEKKDSLTGKALSLIPYLLRYKWHYMAGVVILLLVDVANLYIPQFIGEVIDGLSDGVLDQGGVNVLLAKLFAAGAVMMLGRFGWRFCIFGAARGIEYRLRNDMFGHLETLSARYFNSHKTGDLMARFTNDLNAIRMAVGPAVVTAFDAVVMTVMVLLRMVAYVDFRLTAMAFVPLTLVAVGCYFYGIEAKKRQTRRQEAFSRLSDKVQESIAGVRVLKAFVQEEEDFKAFEEASRNSMEKNLSMVKLRAVFGPALDAVTGISLLVTLVFGGKMVLDGQVSIGKFVAFNSYIGMLVWPMIACGDCINNFSQAAAAFQRISAVFREKPDIVDKFPEAPGDGDTPGPDMQDVHIKGDLTLNNLTFTYPDGEEPVLKNVNVTIPKNKSVAFIGPSGAGKTTMVKLLMRFYDVQKGSIRVDGHDLRDFNRSDLRENFGMVLQDTWLFKGSIMENIRYGRLDATDQEVIAAAKAAHAHRFITTLPGGYQMELNEDASNVSQGQKQLLTIARAILADNPILILDEATSSVDTRTEERIQKAMNNLMRGRTSFVIAHRLSTIKDADMILVMKDGDIIEQGNHQELLEKNGFYAELYNSQFEAA